MSKIRTDSSNVDPENFTRAGGMKELPLKMTLRLNVLSINEIGCEKREPTKEI
jgi:hypothetical protein